MLLRYFYDANLAHASYLVGCQATGDAIVIDPGRNIEPYLQAAADQDMRIVAVAETHIHADFLAGTRELAERTGARLHLSGEGGDDWAYQYLDQYDHIVLRDGAIFTVGNIQFAVIHTPGHTPEHLCFLITDTAAADRPMGIFTGDFVFVGDVGRPDLLEQTVGAAGSAAVGASQMFRSLQRFKDLPDYLQVWPAHGAGSACGKALGAVPSSTVGYEKLFNWAFQHTSEDAFVQELLAGQPEPPRYFATMKQLNKAGPALLRDAPVPEQLSARHLADLLAQGATVIDTRPADAFAATHIPGTLNIPFDSTFTTWAGWLIEYTHPFHLIAEAQMLDTIVGALHSIGLDNVVSFAETAVIDAWAEPTQPLQSYIVATLDQVAYPILYGAMVVIDVRSSAEWAEGHLPGAHHIMLGTLPTRLADIPDDKPVVVQCQTGARSAIGASLLQANGVDYVINLDGGMRDWMAAGLPVE